MRGALATHQEWALLGLLVVDPQCPVWANVAHLSGLVTASALLCLVKLYRVSPSSGRNRILPALTFRADRLLCALSPLSPVTFSYSAISLLPHLKALIALASGQHRATTPTPELSFSSSPSLSFSLLIIFILFLLHLLLQNNPDSSSGRRKVRVYKQKDIFFRGLSFPVPSTKSFSTFGSHGLKM